MILSYKYPELMKIINDTALSDASRKLEIYLRKEAMVAFAGDAGKILDVGCGWGTLSAYLAIKGHEVTGVDSSPGELEHARRIALRYGASARFYIGDALKLDFPDGTFDLVIWEEILEHLVEPVKALREGRRVLKNNGRIILSIPNGQSLRARALKILGREDALFQPDHKQDFGVLSLKKVVEEAGFRIISLTSDFLPIPKLPLGFLLGIRKKFAKRFVTLGHHIIIYGEKIG